MKSNKEVNEHVDEENQTQEGGAKKGTSNAKNCTSRCTGVGLSKIFAVLHEEEKGVLRTTCFAQLLLIDPIATMSILVMKIFDHHLAYENFQNEVIPQKKNTYGLKEIDDALKQAKLERHHAMKSSEIDMQQELVQEVMKNHIEAPVIGVVPAIESPAVDAPIVSAPTIGSSSFATEIGAVVVSVCSQLEEHENLLQQVAPGDGLELVKDLMVDDDVKVGREVNLKAISFEYGGDLPEWKKGEKYGEEKAEDDKEQPQVADEEEVQEASTDQTTVVSVEEHTIEASADQTTTVSVKEQTMEVAKTKDEASQSVNLQIKKGKEEVVEGKDDDDGNSQKKLDPVQEIKEMVVDQTNLVLMESEANVTLKKRHTLIDTENNERAFKMAYQMNQLHAHLDGRIGEEIVCLNVLYTLYPKQWLDNEVIDVYIKALIQYFDTQHRARKVKEKIVLADVFSY
ncbi:hypothetical protein GIB67_041264 [Kingdonia uniflora]|uniref:Uncharacterized protein n=1 Tax=Kingdonia uniflora TaxID=39325 RepID=A0A7J7NIG1_9MAGN|nr:hypothetical protein GIB67_041264 [Kingdonia uniflora]